MRNENFLRRAINTILCVLVLGLAVNCGKKGDPKPPEETAPSAVKYLVARASVESVVLEWYAPTSDASGDPLINLVGFVVRRSIYEKGESPDFERIAEITYNPSESVSKQQPPEPTGQVDKDVGEMFSYEDRQVEPGKKYEYIVLPVNEEGVEGEAAQIIRVTFTGESSLIENL